MHDADSGLYCAVSDRPTLGTDCGKQPRGKAGKATFHLMTLPLWVTFAKTRNGPFPTVVPLVARPTRQSVCLPFESGTNCLPGMESFARQVIQ